MANEEQLTGLDAFVLLELYPAMGAIIAARTAEAELTGDLEADRAMLRSIRAEAERLASSTYMGYARFCAEELGVKPAEMPLHPYFAGHVGELEGFAGDQARASSMCDSLIGVWRRMLEEG